MIIWMVQTNLGHHQDYVMGIQKGCEIRGDRFVGFRAVPFSGEVPRLDGTGLVMAYGSVDVMRALHDSHIYEPGTFYNDSFTYSTYLEKLGDKMLNYGSDVLPLTEAFERIDELADKHSEDGHIFIRPNGDNKEFIGDVVQVDKLGEWLDVVDREDTLLSTDTMAVVGKPWKLNSEWRLFIVDGAPVSCSRYKKNGKLSQSASDIPTDMLEFVHEIIGEWLPAPVCVIDVCETGGRFYVVEFNCFNSSGFYKNNIPHITCCISDYIERTYSR